MAFLQLQREVPERVNTALAEAAARAGVPVLLDAGGAAEGADLVPAKLWPALACPYG